MNKDLKNLKPTSKNISFQTEAFYDFGITKQNLYLKQQ